MVALRRVAPRIGATLALAGCALGTTALGSSGAVTRGATPATASGVTRSGFQLIRTAPGRGNEIYLRVLTAVTRSHKPLYQLVGPGSVAIPLTSGHGDAGLLHRASRHGWTHIAVACSRGTSLTLVQHGKVEFRFAPCNGRGVWQNTFPAAALRPGSLRVEALKHSVWAVVAITNGNRRNAY